MYTLRTLIESGILSDAHLLTDPMDFSHIEISSISVQEFPLDDFIQKNELVLSTALGYDIEPERFLLLVQSAVDAQAAAIAFAFKDSSIRLPPPALAAATAAGLPILQLPWELRFSQIQAAVLDAIQQDKLAIFQSIQNKLFNLFFESKTLEDAIHCIAQHFGCGTCIIQPSGEEMAVGSNISPPQADRTYETQVEIRLNGILMGYLHLMVSPDFLAGKEALMEKFLAFPLSLWFNKQHIENMTATRLRNDFIRNLATGNYTSYQEMVQQGAQLNFDLNKPYTCIMMKAVLKGSGTDIPEYSNQIAQDAQEIERIMLQEGKRRRLNTMVTNLSLEFTIFLENAPHSTNQDVLDYVDQIEKQILRQFPSFQCLWGISETTLCAPDFCRLYANASLALQYCINTKNTHHRLTYKDTKKALIVSVLSSHEDIRKNAQELLQPLMDYDAASDIGLFSTLVEYIRTNYNTSQTARNLYIHRQSLLYRMEKIEQLTGMSLHDHEDLFVLESMARIYASF